MLKALLSTLKEVKNGAYTEAFIEQGLDYLIPNSYVYTMYSMKFELNRNKFKGYLKDIIGNMDIFKQDDELLGKTLEVSHKWYCHLLDNKSLNGANSSLKSELKKIYKKLIPDLKGFDRFYEKIFNAIQEAYNVYTIILYNPEAIIENVDFAPDREVCYINSRTDYLTAIKQANTYYVMVYKNNTPVTRIWFVADKDFENVAIFNQYGFKFKNLSKFFSDPAKSELFQGDYKKLGDILGVYVNDDTVLVTTDDYNKFVYELHCPTCNHKTLSNYLTLICEIDDEYGFDRTYKLKCPRCGDLVWSDIHKKYIPHDEAIYSEYHKTYLYRNDAVFSLYLNSYIHSEIALYVWNYDEDGYTHIPKEMTVYSEYYAQRMIKEQVIYSELYKSYIPKSKAIYSEELDSYIFENDRVIKVKDKYIAESQLEMMISPQSLIKPVVSQYVGAWCY